MADAPLLDWSRIDTVLLDMDGTLLDLGFDNWFWQEHVPRHYAAAKGLTDIEVRRLLSPRFQAIRGTLSWYCIEHWSRELELDIAVIKRDALERVRYLPGAEEFLDRLARLGKRRVLLTNAHPTTLAIKDAKMRLTARFEACYSSHAFGAPKEDAAFWPRLHRVEPFVAERTLFVDDSVPVLDAAHAFGVRWLCGIRRPDSTGPAQSTGMHPAVDRVSELITDRPR